MTRKDYEAIARAIARVRHDWGIPNGGLIPLEVRHAIEEIEDAIAQVLKEDNPRFDRYKFLQACVPQR